jgi:hypothetical protein
MNFYQKSRRDLIALLILAALLLAYVLVFSGAHAYAQNTAISPTGPGDLQVPHCEFRVIGGMCQINVLGRTNLVAYRPLSTQAYLIRVFDMAGNELSKTFYGRRFGQPLKPDQTLLDGSWSNSIAAGYGHLRIIDFAHYGNEDGWAADIPKSFHLQEPGNYRVRVELRLFTKGTNGDYQPFFLPPVESIVKIYDIKSRE